MTSETVTLPTAAEVVRATEALQAAIRQATMWLEDADDLPVSIKNSLHAAFGCEHSVADSQIRRAESAVVTLQDAIVAGKEVWTGVNRPPGDLPPAADIAGLRALEQTDRLHAEALTAASGLHAALVKGERLLPVVAEKSKRVVVVVLSAWENFCQDRDAEMERQIAGLKAESERRRQAFKELKQRYAG